MRGILQALIGDKYHIFSVLHGSSWLPSTCSEYLKIGRKLIGRTCTIPILHHEPMATSGLVECSGEAASLNSEGEQLG
jgi:hypothetical protein